MAAAPKVEWSDLALGQIKPAPYNPRTIGEAEFEGLDESVSGFGLVQNLVVNRRTKARGWAARDHGRLVLVGGHQRLKVLKRKKAKKAHCCVVELDEVDEKSLNLALNNPEIAGQFDDKLGAVLDRVKDKREEMYSRLRLEHLEGVRAAVERAAKAANRRGGPTAPEPDPDHNAGDWALHCGNMLEVLPELAENSVDAVVTDPPYEIDFMGRSWDRSGVAFQPATWAEVLRVLKPGGYLLAFGATRTSHRITCAIEDAGFEIRDLVAWMFGTGFPKSLNDVGRAGWGTALKPALEPVTMARKPLEGTVADNVAKWGTGAINIEACRVGDSKRVPGSPKRAAASSHTVSLPGVEGGSGHDPEVGRWPADVVFDEVTADMIGDEVSRFFYTAKVSRGEREAGVEHLPEHTAGEVTDRKDGSAGLDSPRAGAGRGTGARNFHPTVKPIELMRYLVRLVTPPGGRVLDPFAGSGTTGIAAVLEGKSFTGVEMDTRHAVIAWNRIRHWATGGGRGR